MKINGLHVAFAVLVNFMDLFWSGLRREVATGLTWIVDAARWLGREHVRRTGRQSGAHRTGRSVWDILHARPEEEQEYEWRPAGRHYDRRGWRYKPAVWALIERTSDERRWVAYWRETVQNLMGDIRFMLDNPPQVATPHGCSDCKCGVTGTWREVNA